MRDRPIHRGHPGLARSLALVATVGALAHLWVLGLPFQLDDYTQIPEATAFFSRGSGEDIALPKAAPESASTAAYLYRPILWFVWTLESRLSGIPLEPWLFHLGSLLLHLATSVLVLILMRRFFSPFAAVAGALFFVVHPAGSEAVSWVAAGGDLLATFFGVLCVLVLRRSTSPPSWLEIILTGVLLCLAFLSKESAFILLPIVLWILICRLRPLSLGATIARIAFALLPLALGYGLRCLTLGSWSLRYAGGLEAGPASLARMAAKLPDVLRFLLVPWHVRMLDEFPPLIVQGARWLELAPDLVLPLIAVFSSLPVMALVLAPRRALRSIFATGILVVFLVAPASFASPPGEGAVFSRALYLPMVALAALLASVVDALTSKSRFRRWRHVLAPVVAALLGLQFAISTDAMITIARLQGRAGDSVRQCVSAVDAALRPSDDITVLAILPGGGLGPVPMIGSSLPRAFRRPFAASDREVIWKPKLSDIEAGEVLRRVTSPIQILTNAGHTLIPRGSALPAIPAELPELTLIEPMRNGVAAWRPRSAVPTRGIEALALRIAKGPEGVFEVSVSSERETRVKALTLTGHREVEDVTVLLDDDLSWLEASSLERVELDIPAERLVTPPVLLRNAPALGITLRPGSERFALGHVPVIEISGLSEPARLKVSFELELEGAWWPAMVFGFEPDPSSLLESAVVELKTDATKKIASSLHPHLSWESAKDLLRQLLRTSVPSELSWRVRAEAVDPRTETIKSRSPWRSVVTSTNL